MVPVITKQLNALFFFGLTDGQQWKKKYCPLGTVRVFLYVGGTAFFRTKNKQLRIKKMRLKTECYLM
jgi:hypothetical protein